MVCGLRQDKDVKLSGVAFGLSVVIGVAEQSSSRKNRIFLLSTVVSDPNRTVYKACSVHGASGFIDLTVYNTLGWIYCLLVASLELAWTWASIPKYVAYSRQLDVVTSVNRKTLVGC